MVKEIGLPKSKVFESLWGYVFSDQITLYGIGSELTQVQIVFFRSSRVRISPDFQIKVFVFV